MWKDTDQFYKQFFARVIDRHKKEYKEGVTRSIAELDLLLSSGVSPQTILEIEAKQPIVPGISPEVTLEALKLRGLIQ